MRSHRIRLAGPWEWQSIPESSATSSPREVDKCQLPFPSEHDAVASDGLMLRRRFHCPTGIDASTSVSVMVEVQDCIPEVRLNNRGRTGVKDIAIPNQWRFDVSGLLKPFNELQVQLVPLLSDSQVRLNAATLEIQESE